MDEELQHRRRANDSAPSIFSHVHLDSFGEEDVGVLLELIQNLAEIIRHDSQYRSVSGSRLVFHSSESHRRDFADSNN